MKKHTATSRRRLFAWLMVLLTACQMLPVVAFAAEDWKNLVISVGYTDGNGNPASAAAMPVEGAGENVFWMQVDGSAFSNGMTLHISHPNHPNYAFVPGEGEPLATVQDPGGVLDPNKAVYINAFENGGSQPVATYLLYISTATVPAPEPVTGSVDVVYVNQADGAELARETRSLTQGDNSIQANSGKVPQGYTLVGSDTQNVTLYADGTKSPETVTFTYAPPAPATGTVDVVYVSEADGSELGRETRELTQGDNPIQANSGKVPQGYTLVGSDTQNVTLYADGTKSPETVTFTYAPPAPATGTVDVVYVSQTDGSELARETRPLAQGNNPIQADSSKVPQGYTLVGSDTQSVTLNADGSKSPETVTFTYAPPAAVTGSVDVVYVSQADESELARETRPLAQGNNPIQADSSKVPQGYILVGGDTQNVNLGADGSKSPEVVTFTYAPPAAVTGSVDVVYVSQADGSELARETRPLAQGNNPIQADSSKVPQGYTLVGGDTQSVTLNADGSKSPETVTFTYAPPAVVQIQVPVIYMGDDGETLYSGSVNVPVGGQVPVPVDLTRVTNSSYTLNDESTKTAAVDASGKPNPEQVVFNFAYHAPAEPTPNPVEVPIRYVKDGANFHTTKSSPIPAGSSLPVLEDVNLTPAGYQLDGPSTVTVTVDAKGVASPSEVVFTYKAIPAVSKTISIYYKNTSGQDVASSQQKTLGVGTHQVLPEPANLQPNYRLQGDNTQTVTVNADGTSDVNNITFIYVYATAETPIPVGSRIDRWSKTNAGGLNFRTGPGTNYDTVIKTQLAKDTYVWMYQTQTNDKGEEWTRVRVNGQDGYLMTKFLNVLTQAESDAYQASLATPMPTQLPTASPSAAPGQYIGYALTTKQVALRTDANLTDQSILKTLPAQTLVSVYGQINQNNVSWSLVETLDDINGYLTDDSLKRITAAEAQVYIDQYNQSKATPIPTVTITPSPSAPPVQQSGYAITIGDNVPMRGMADPNSMLVNMLAKNVVVYVTGQEYLAGQAWHISQYLSQWGYIRADQLRMLTRAETDAYLKSLVTPTPTPAAVTPPPVDVNSKSSYGYVATDSVNFRSAPGGSKISTLNKYAFALVLGSTVVDGKTWYKVNQAGKEGYIHGDYFHVLTIAELEEFLQSPEYVQGVTGGSSSGSGSTGNNNNSGSSNQTPSSLEDWNVGVWTNPNSGLTATYEPFDPYATPEPLPTPTATASLSPTSSLTPLGTVPPDELTQDTQTDNPPYLLMGLGAVLLAGAGGLYAYSIYRSNQRKAAARAQQRRAAMQQQQGAQSGGRPYARATNAPMVPPVAGTQSKQPPAQGAARQPLPGTAPNPNNPYGPKPGPAGMAPTSQQRPTAPRPAQPGTPGQSPYAPRPSAQGMAQAPETNRPQPTQGVPSSAPAQQIRPDQATGDAGSTARQGVYNGTARQPRATRHLNNDGSAESQNPVDTNKSL